MKSVKLEGLTLHIEPDDWQPESPRETQDNLGKMYGWHRRYTIGDKNPYPTSQDFWDDKKLQDEIFTYIKVYLLDHSGLWVSNAPFACDPDGWDSGVVGIVYATKENVLKEFGDLSDDSKFKANARLVDEIKEYDNYLHTEYNWFWIEGLDGENLESCGGFETGDDAEMLKAMKDCAPEEYYPLFDKAIREHQSGAEM